MSFATVWTEGTCPTYDRLKKFEQFTLGSATLNSIHKHLSISVLCLFVASQHAAHHQPRDRDLQVGFFPQKKEEWPANNV